MNRRALAIDDTGLVGYLEIPDTDVLKVASISPGTGNLVLGGATAADGIVITAGHDLGMSGDSVFTLAGTGNLNITASGIHAISNGSLDVNVTSDFSNTLQLSAGADLTAGAGSALSGFDTIEGILSGNLVDKSAAETITGQWIYQAGAGTNPKLVVKAAGGEAANSILFQVQTSVGANLFSVDVEGDVVIAGGETVAGAVVYTGDITLGDGGNTIQIGSAILPAVGDNVYINTTGTANGNFSITTANYVVDISGNQTMGGNLTLTSGGTITTTLNGNLTLSTDGTGVINATSNLNASAGLDVSGAPLTSSAGLTLTLAGITMTGLDIGTALARAGTGYFTTLDATTINGTLGATSYGTNAPAWVTNLDAAAGTAEDAITVNAAGDGANVQAWRWFNDSSAKTFSLQYKQDPTSLTNTAEAYALNSVVAYSNGTIDFPYNVNAQAGLDVTNAALTVDANGIDCAGGIDLNGILSFDGVAASTIDTSGNNPLSIDVGTSTLDVTAGLVDLSTNVTALDVPSGIAFNIGGVALTTANFTAPNVDTLLDGSNADALHTHSAVDADQLRIPGLTTAAMAQYQAGYVSANNIISPTITSSGAGSFISATFAGVYDAVAGTMVNAGKVEVQFDAGLAAPAPAAGQPAILSWVNNGQFRNIPPASGSGHWMTRAGIILDASNYGTNQRCIIIIQPDRPIQR